MFIINIIGVFLKVESRFKTVKEETDKIKEKSDVATKYYKIGKVAGNYFFDNFIKYTKGKENRIKKIFEILNLTDYGKFEFKCISGNFINVKLTRSSLVKLCLGNERSSSYWICNWMSGFLSGLFNNVDKRWFFERSKCRESGHNYCEFKGKIL